MKLRIWQIPAIPSSERFTVPVTSVLEAAKMSILLAMYDKYQVTHGAKPDAFNAGGTEMLLDNTEKWVPFELTDSWDETFDDPISYILNSGDVSAETRKEFSEFNQSFSGGNI